MNIYQKIATFTVILIFGLWLLLKITGNPIHLHFLPQNPISSNNPAQPKSPSESNSPVNNITILRNVPYETINGQTLALDIFQPTNGIHPAIVMVHGGGYAVGDKSSFEDVSSRVAYQGFVVFNINYRLAPPDGVWHYPAESDDVHAAVAWIRTHGSQYNTNTTKVGAIGGSAGGNLVMMAATTGTNGVDKVDAAVSLSGPTAYDLPPNDAAGFTGNGRIKAITHVASYFNCTVQQFVTFTCSQDTIKGASPAYHVDSTSSPIFIANSTDELTPLNQAEFMASQMQKANVPYVLKIVPGHGHAHAIVDAVWNDMISFLKKYLTN